MKLSIACAFLCAALAATAVACRETPGSSSTRPAPPAREVAPEPPPPVAPPAAHDTSPATGAAEDVDSVPRELTRMCERPDARPRLPQHLRTVAGIRVASNGAEDQYHVDAALRCVVRSAAQWRVLRARLGGGTTLKQVDGVFRGTGFSRHMLVAVLLGLQGSTSGWIDAYAVGRRGDTLWVRVRSREAGGPGGDMFTTPADFLVVPKVPHVVFVEAADPMEGW